MHFENQIFLLMARGLSAWRKLAILDAVKLEEGDWPVLMHLKPWDLDDWVRKLCPAGGARRGIHWPDPADVRALARRMFDKGIEVIWKGQTGYPACLADALDADAPAWIFVAGDLNRLSAQQISIVGSREIPMQLAEAARLLARELADAGFAVASGLARGADRAAHEGAMEGHAGTVGVPARGLLTIPKELAAAKAGRMTLLGLAPPEAGFQAHHAIARNDVVAALGKALVVVAGELRGGSCYAIRWMLRRHRPLWCFECGGRTPKGNQNLINAGLAKPLALEAHPEAWVADILDGLKTSRETKGLQSNIMQPCFLPC